MEQMISVGYLIIFLSKQTLFLAFHRAQQIAASPTIWKCFPPPRYKFTQIQNWLKELGRQGAPITIATMLHTYLASEQSKKRWSIVSFSWQNLHLTSPCQFLLVRMAFWFISHIKILIFSGIFAFQILLLGQVVLSLHIWEYMDLTEKVPDFSQSHLGLSFAALKGKAAKMSLSLLRRAWSFSSSHLLKDRLHPFAAMSLTLTFCSEHISNRLGKKGR